MMVANGSGKPKPHAQAMVQAMVLARATVPAKRPLIKAPKGPPHAAPPSQSEDRAFSHIPWIAMHAHHQLNLRCSF